MSFSATPEETICAAFLNGNCLPGGECVSLHHHLPYLWQGWLEASGAWVDLTEPGVVLEKAFSLPGTVACNTQMPITYADGAALQIVLQVDFEKMVGHLEHPAERWSEQSFIKIRRLSTPSYAAHLASKTDKDSDPPPASCPWRWYHDDVSSWKLFESELAGSLLQDDTTPMQSVLESKYLAGQKIYRFEVDVPVAAYARPPTASMAFLLNFACMELVNLNTEQRCRVRRRPLFVSPDYCLLRVFPPLPTIKPVPFTSELPSNWFPVDTKSDYELVPLDPECMEYHMVASEFSKSGPPDWCVQDIYRLQNPFLWHKFHCKRQYMEQKNKNANELLLFHGTSAETSVQSIFRLNFDWRLCGKNATCFGDGSYFARDAALSDRYTGGGGVVRKRWMFLARVLVGKYTKGAENLKRPPPIDMTKPHGDLYDSCVNKTSSPTIYVVFENDQCYPEYVICYTR